MTTRMTRMWLAVCLVVVFVAGVATGVTLHVAIRSVAAANEVQASRLSPGLLTSMLGSELHLTQDQRDRLEAIVAARRKSFVSARDVLRARLAHDASGLVAEIQHDLNLTSEQRARFDMFVARVRAKYLSADSPAEGNSREEKERPRGL